MNNLGLLEITEWELWQRQCCFRTAESLHCL